MKDQNLIFTRASIFSEGSKYCSFGNVVPKDDDIFLEYIDGIWGHDIPGTVILDYFNQADYWGNNGDQRDECGLNPHENAFYNNVLQKIDSQIVEQGFAVITAFSDLRDNYGTNEYLLDVVSHETLHAQYFLNEKIRNAVKKYWVEVLTAQEHQSVKDAMRDFYDVTNEYLVLNEFLAYMGAYGDPRSYVGSLVGQHKEHFLRYVEKKSGADLFEFPEM
ncbi:MAG: hypothetical protein KDD48_03515 [Bdellovibrionales bacterium]|nr:hypothetical protein [Bdellovibrionales bacterium]